MAMTGTAAPSALQLKAPTMDSPWAWMTKGWRDVWAAPQVGLLYGAAFAAIGLAITGGLYALDQSALIPVFACCFALLGPLMAVGLYEVSRRLEAGEPVTLRAALRAKIAEPIQLGLVVFLLFFVVFVWIRIALLLYALFLGTRFMDLPAFVAWTIGTWDGMTFIVVGSAVGFVLASLAFAVGALSIPILMRRNVDAFTAIWASFATVVRHPGPMFLWAWLIALVTGFGLATGFLGLIVAFPLAGHATWHAYRDLVDGPG